MQILIYIRRHDGSRSQTVDDEIEFATGGHGQRTTPPGRTPPMYVSTSDWSPSATALKPRRIERVCGTDGHIHVHGLSGDILNIDVLVR